MWKGWMSSLVERERESCASRLIPGRRMEGRERGRETERERVSGRSVFACEEEGTFLPLVNRRGCEHPETRLNTTKDVEEYVRLQFRVSGFRYAAEF